ncbi:MAG: Uma2 family endonuclease [Planctomycetaceae bacterium]
MSQVLESRPSWPRSRGGSTLPPLENGDHLDQKSFHERYEAMPEGFKAELIQGRVYVPSPVRRVHGRPHTLVTGWLLNYEAATPGVESLVDTTAILDDENEPQPDSFLIVRPDHGGRTHVDSNGYIAGPPELAVEIAASTAAFDLFEKREAYERTGILEYVIVVVRSQEIRWLRLTDQRYIDVAVDESGVFRSQEFPGLWLNSKALFAEDAKQLLETLNQGLASPEHAEFMRQLEERKAE